MYINEWDEKHWDQLIYSIRHDKCILMLGPYASLEINDETGELSSSSELLTNELAAEVPDCIENWGIDVNSLQQVAQCYQKKEGRIGLLTKISGFYEKRKNWTSPIHEDLSHLPFSLSITSSPDNMLFNAIKEHPDKSPKVASYNYKGKAVKIDCLGSPAEPFIFHLYGRFDDDNSLVITENDLLEYLINVASKKPGIPEIILSELQDREKCLMFVGFGFKHWYLKVLLHILKIGTRDRKAFALEEIRPNSAEAGAVKQTIMFFKRRGCEICISNLEPKNFTSTLKIKYTERYSQDRKGQIQKEIESSSEKKPTVFISYVRENSKTVKLLTDFLMKNGIDTWLDINNLRGGNNWSEQITEIIKQVDNFIVMHSQQLNQQDESYVFTEIEVALDRKKRLNPKRSFIIPVKLDTAELLPSLQPFHALDLILDEKKNISTSAAGAEKLIESIQKDFQLRQIQQSM